jgi:hypothetical protein
LDVQPVYDDMLRVEYKSPINRQTQLLGTQGFQHFSQVLDDIENGDMFPSKPTASSSACFIPPRLPAGASDVICLCPHIPTRHALVC